MQKRKEVFFAVLFLIGLAVLFLFDALKDDRQEAEKQTLSCKVVAVADGDTLTAQCNRFGKPEQVRVRLVAIDAPEYDYKNKANIQPYAAQSREHLKALCLHKMADIRSHDTDQYGRLIATVVCEGHDVNVAQVEAGMAWVYVQYADDHKHLYVAEERARQQKTGLWASSHPTPPWQWRQSRR